MSQRQPPSPGFGAAAMLAWIHDFAPYGVITTDTTFAVQSWNRWMELHSEHSADRVLQRNLFELFPDLSTRGLRKRFERALAGEVSVLSTGLHRYLIELPPTPRNGPFEQMQQTARIAPLIEGDRVIGTIVVIEDVTERRPRPSVSSANTNPIAFCPGRWLTCSSPDTPAGLFVSSSAKSQSTLILTVTSCT